METRSQPRPAEATSPQASGTGLAGPRPPLVPRSPEPDSAPPPASEPKRPPTSEKQRGSQQIPYALPEDHREAHRLMSRWNPIDFLRVGGPILTEVTGNPDPLEWITTNVSRDPLVLGTRVRDRVLGDGHVRTSVLVRRMQGAHANRMSPGVLCELFCRIGVLQEVMDTP